MKLNETKAWNEQKFIAEAWIGSEHQDIKLLSAAAIGSFGEKIVKELLERHGYDVGKRLNTEHDFTVNGKKTELKTSTAVIGSDRRYIINQIRPQSDYDMLIMFLIDPNGYRLYSAKKEEYMMENQVEGLKYQHGGQKQKGNTLILNVIEKPPKANLMLEVNYAANQF